MKKLLLFALLVCTSIAANAAKTNYSLYIDTYPWNYTAEISGKIHIDFTSQWGEFKLTPDNTVDISEYVGYKIVVSEVQDAHMNMGNADNSWSYPDLVVGTNEYTFDTDFGNLTAFEIQGTEADGYITVDEAYLVKADGTEEAMVYGGASWGCSLDVYDPATITYTGQYGGVYIFNPETGEPATHTYGEGTEEVYTVVIAEATEQELTVELDKAKDDGEGTEGFAWISVPAGTTTFDITVNDEVCEGNDVSNIYIKANGEEGFPFTVKYVSITTGEDDEEGNTEEDDDYFVSLDFEGDNSAWTLYDGDKIEITTGGPDDTEGNYLSVDYGNEAWGVGAYPASTPVIYQTSAKKLSAGTYTVSATICVGGECNGLIDLYATNSDGTVYSKASISNSSDYGVASPTSVEVTLADDDYLTIGITTNDSWADTAYLWLYADNFAVVGTATGITSVTTEVPAITDGAIYNLAGQRVTEGTKGLLIKNGKKVLVK